MGRQNSPASLSHWDSVAASAPFRASISGQASWDVERPSPSLALASRVSPGGRLLLAFGHEALRDCFVEGHLDQGAQCEANEATHATAWNPSHEIVQAQKTEDEIIDDFKKANALRLYPLKIPQPVIDKAENITQSQAENLRDFFRQKQVWIAADKAMQKLIHPIVEECVAKKDHERLRSWIAKVPPGYWRAHLTDAIEYRLGKKFVVENETEAAAPTPATTSVRLPRNRP